MGFAPLPWAVGIATMEKTDIKQLEAEFSKEPSVGRLVTLIDGYLDQRDTRSLEKALSLVLRNLEKYSDDTAFLYRATKILTLVKENAEAAKLASELSFRLVQLEPNKVKWHINAAYIQWRLGNIVTAIELSEIALKNLAKFSASNEQIVTLKGNLAYYYAERGRIDDAEQAKQLAIEVYRESPTPSHADTLGYTLLRFAKDAVDLKEAAKYLEEAHAQINKFGIDAEPIISAHLAEVAARLKEKKAVGS
jgi:tetratricopeptide (TPR) repeat protein